VLDAFDDGSYPNQLPAANAYSYDTEKDSWQKLAGLSPGRRRGGAGAATYNGKLYLVCGIKHGHVSGTCNLFDVYDPATDKWTAMPDAPHIRDHSMAVVIGDQLFAVGGRNTSQHDPGNFMSFFNKTVLDVDRFDFKTGKWTTLSAKLPQGTGGGTAVNLDGKLFYIGGERATDTKPNGPQADVYYLDPSHPDKWIKEADLNAPRNGVGGTVYDHKIYIAGGSGGGPKPNGPPPASGPGGPAVGGMPGDPPPSREPANGNPPALPPGAKPEGQADHLLVEEFIFSN
jgi:N-acetylneuraminic acid mutarotase